LYVILDEDSYLEVDLEICRRIVKVSSGSYQCSLCDHVSNQKGNMINHIEARHIPGPGITCHLCNRHISTRQSYRMHLARVHDIKYK